MIIIETIYSIFNLISSPCIENLIPRYLLSLTSTILLLTLKAPTGAKNPQKSVQYYLACLLNLLALFNEIKLTQQLDDFFLISETKNLLRIDILLEIFWKFHKFQPLTNGIITYLYIPTCFYVFYLVTSSLQNLACCIKFISQAIFLCVILLKKHQKATKDPHHKILRNVFDYVSEGTIVLNIQGEIKIFNKSLENFIQIVNKLTLEDLNKLFLDLKFIEKSSTSISISPPNDPLQQLRPSRAETSLGFSSPIIPSAEDSYFDENIPGITNLKDLFNFYIHLKQNVSSTFRARVHHHHTQEWHDMEIKAYLLTDLEEKHLLLSIKDLTEFDRKSLSLEKDKLIYRDSLIASFSHELRTPLNSNLGFLEQSLDSNLIPLEAKEKFIQPALTSGRLLLFIVSDILDYSLILAHGLRLDITGQNLVENINSCLKLIQPKLVEKGLRFKFTNNASANRIIFTDHKRLSQILINLLNNAIQFTMKGDLEVILTSSVEDSLIITVKDTGIGMDEKSQEKLQNNLDQEELNQKVNDSSIGIGLGLFISNKLVKMLNDGTGLKFTSIPGKGSQFYFGIKNHNHHIENSPSNAGRLDRSEIEQIFNINTRVRQYSTKSFKNIFTGTNQRTFQGKVLVVDDEIFNIKVIENFCKAAGIEVEKALNGREAIDKLRVSQSPPIKMVFMDINMPVMDGYQATKEVHKMIENEEIEDVTVIGVTAYIAWEKIEKGYSSGMAEILTKPVSKDMIMEVFKKYRII